MDATERCFSERVPQSHRLGVTGDEGTSVMGRSGGHHLNPTTELRTIRGTARRSSVEMGPHDPRSPGHERGAESESGSNHQTKEANPNQGPLYRTTSLPLEKEKPAAPFRRSELRIQHCHWGSRGRCCGTGSNPDLGTSTCHKHSQKGKLSVF